MKHLTLPLTPEAIASLRAGDEVLLTGWLYTGRDAAHKRMVETLDEAAGKALAQVKQVADFRRKHAGEMKIVTEELTWTSEN